MFLPIEKEHPPGTAIMKEVIEGKDSKLRARTGELRPAGDQRRLCSAAKRVAAARELIPTLR